MIFVTIKLCGAVDWPWWIVLLPFWIPATYAVILLIIYYAFFHKP